MKPLHFLGAFLALSTSHLFANEPSGAFLAPATTTGAEADWQYPVGGNVLIPHAAVCVGLKG